MIDPRPHSLPASLPFETARERFDALDVPFAVVTGDDGRYVGSLTGRAFRSRAEEPQPRTAGEAADRGHPTASPATPKRQRIDLLVRAGADFLPILEDGRVVAIEALHPLLGPPRVENLAVLMAGGRGTRLWPVTENRIPKPMVRVGPRPLIETTIERLRDLGFHRFALCIHHLGRHLVEHFGDGSRLGVGIRFVVEEEPLGTAGGLAELPAEERAVAVLNADILTGHDIARMTADHEASGAAATVGVRAHTLQVPFGVVEVDAAGGVVALREKPVQALLVNAGIYVLSPRALARLRRGERRDMTGLLAELIASGERVASCPVEEPWLDVGTPASYAEAVGAMERSFGE